MTGKFYPGEEVHILTEQLMQVLDELQEGAVFYLLIKREDLKAHPTFSTSIVLRHANGLTSDLRYLWDIARVKQDLPKDFTGLHILLTRQFEWQYQGVMNQRGQIIDL